MTDGERMVVCIHDVCIGVYIYSVCMLCIAVTICAIVLICMHT